MYKRLLFDVTSVEYSQRCNDFTLGMSLPLFSDWGRLKNSDLDLEDYYIDINTFPNGNRSTILFLGQFCFFVPSHETIE